MTKTDRCVVRNQSYKKAGFSIRERHNERLNESYFNSDIQPDRRHLNVYFKQCDGGYTETFEKMLADGAVSTRGQKAGAKVFDELVFDVNTAYFENNGGYEYARTFFEEAYRCAVKEIGGEEYVLSAVMHADERNKALSEEKGYPVFHYHLHVVYIPVVDKEILWSKRCKDPALVGTVKDVIKQVSHSKKWPRYKTEKGWVNSYSLLQDRFHDHMKNAGFIGFERGERGSTAEHLSVLEYKSQQETKRAESEDERAAAYTAVVEQKQETAAALDMAIGDKERTVAKLDNQTAKKREQLDVLEKKTAVVKAEAITVAEVEAMGKLAKLSGNIIVTPAEMKKLKPLAREGVKSRGIIAGLKKRVDGLLKEVGELKKKLERYEGRTSILEELNYHNAQRRAPRRMAAVIAEIMRSPAERTEQQHTAPERKRGHGMEH